VSAIPGRMRDSAGADDSEPIRKPRKNAAGGRIRLSGEVRSPIDPSPTVCRFYGRCPQGETRCGSEMPTLRKLADERAAACHFACEHFTNLETDRP